jgi:outer membrane receptor protein involved in Fe transport
LSLYYARGQQQDGRRYDQLNGGNGNLRSGFDPQVLDFFYGRYERRALGWLDSLAATVSFNRIRDDRQTQSGDPASAITFDFARTDSRGYQVQATSHVRSRQVLGWGAELFDESVRSRMHRLDPATGVAGPLERPRFPNRARYRTVAAYLQDTADLVPGRWRLTGGGRYSAFRYSDPAGVLMRTDDLTYYAGSSYFLTPALTLNAIASRGFRAPNIADLSQIGLTSNGFEVAPDTALRPESLVNYETGLKLHSRRVTSEVSYFVSGIHDLITKRALILPPGAVGGTIGGERIIFQDPTQGWVRVAVDGRPVVTRANVGEIRIAGIEISQRLRLSSDWTFEGNFFRLRGRDRATSAPPELEGGLPPATGHASLRYHPGSRWWLEAASNVAWRQDRLSSLELADQRIGASRTRASIANYFNNGARPRGLVAAGILLATGETLAQVQDRVLGPGVASAVWHRSTPGYAIFHLRAGVQLSERSTLGLLVENVLDRNYRTHGSGIDGAGRHVQLRYTVRF